MLPETVLIYLQLKAKFIIISYLAKKIKYCYSYNVLRETLGSSLNSKPLCLVKPSGHGASLRVTRRLDSYSTRFYSDQLHSSVVWMCVFMRIGLQMQRDRGEARRLDQEGHSIRVKCRRKARTSSPRRWVAVSTRWLPSGHADADAVASRSVSSRPPVFRFVSFRVRTRDSVPLEHTVVSADCSLLSLSLSLHSMLPRSWSMLIVLLVHRSKHNGAHISLEIGFSDSHLHVVYTIQYSARTVQPTCADICTKFITWMTIHGVQQNKHCDV